MTNQHALLIYKKNSEVLKDFLLALSLFRNILKNQDTRIRGCFSQVSSAKYNIIFILFHRFILNLFRCYVSVIQNVLIKIKSNLTYLITNR